MLDVPERLKNIPSGRLQEVVQVAIGRPEAVIGKWEVVAPRGGFGGLTGRSWVCLLRGVACASATEYPWRVVLKVLAPVADQNDPNHIDFGKREPLLYRSRLLDDLPGGLRAPRCLGCDETADGSVWLWQEYIEEDGEHIWSAARWALAARHLGQFNGAYLTQRPLPRASWLGGQRLHTWLEGRRPLVAKIAAAPGNPAICHWWPRPIVDAILHLWEERNAFCAALERLPQTFGHGDAIRRNLLSQRRVDGSDETVAIDWEHAGHYAVGEEVGQTLSVASAFFDLEPADLPSLDEALFASYLTGLRDAGWRGEPRQVRFAYKAHAALRNAFNAVGATVPDEATRAVVLQNQGRTWEDLAERRAVLRPFLLECALEARRLLETL